MKSVRLASDHNVIEPYIVNLANILYMLLAAVGVRQGGRGGGGGGHVKYIEL